MVMVLIIIFGGSRPTGVTRCKGLALLRTGRRDPHVPLNFSIKSTRFTLQKVGEKFAVCLSTAPKKSDNETVITCDDWKISDLC